MHIVRYPKIDKFVLKRIYRKGYKTLKSLKLRYHIPQHIPLKKVIGEYPFSRFLDRIYDINILWYTYMIYPSGVWYNWYFNFDRKYLHVERSSQLSGQTDSNVLCCQLLWKPSKLQSWFPSEPTIISYPTPEVQDHFLPIIN
jgi:hypothetical protein